MIRARAARVAIPLLLAMLLSARPAAASCSVDDQGPCYWYWHVDAVFVGQVIEKNLVREAEFGNEYRLVVRVVEPFRGPKQAGAIVTVRVFDGECGTDADVGEELFFYADNTEGELRPTIHSGPLEDSTSGLQYARSVSDQGPGAMVYGEVLHREDPVVSADSFTSVEGVRVRVWNANFEAEVVTDKEGEYAINLPGAGKYTVEVYPPDGLADSLFDGHIRFEIKDPRECQHTEFQLVSNGRIRGRVVDADGRPFSNLVLQVNDDRHRQAKTDDDGAFELGPLSEERSYTIEGITGGDGVTFETSEVMVRLGKTTVMPTLTAITTRKLATLTIDLAGFTDDVAYVELLSKATGDVFDSEVQIGTATELTFVVERGASFDIDVSGIGSRKTAVIKVDSPRMVVTLAQLVPRPPQ